MCTVVCFVCLILRITDAEKRKSDAACRSAPNVHTYDNKVKNIREPLTPRVRYHTPLRWMWAGGKIESASDQLAPKWQPPYGSISYVL